MKNIVFIFLLLLFSCFIVDAQPPRHRDTTRIGFEAGRAECVNAPILRGNGQGVTIVPNRQQFCFDLEIDVELNYGGSSSRETTLFINTTDGYMGYTTPSAGGPITELMPEIESFRFTIMSFKLGNIFSYFNRKGKNGIEHLLTTSNTDAHEYQTNGLLTAAPLQRKSEYRNYCDGKARALAYKRDDGPTVWYMYGDRFPATLQVQKFLGGFGVGVARTDAGVFIIMELSQGRNYTAIKHIEQRRVCFNPTDFKMQEADFYVKRAASLDQEELKINADEEKAQRAPCCIAEHMAEVNYSREQLQVQRQNLQRSQQGNLVQDRGAQKAMTGMMDPMISVETSILSTRTSICVTRFYSGTDPNRASLKINCLNQLLADLTQAESQMRAIERQYANNIPLALVQKSRIYMNVVNRGGCN